MELMELQLIKIKLKRLQVKQSTFDDDDDDFLNTFVVLCIFAECIADYIASDDDDEVSINENQSCSISGL